MKTLRWHCPVPVLFALSLLLPAGLFAAAPAERAASSFELPRLKAPGKPEDSRAMAREHATVHDLAPNGKPSAHARNDQNVDYLAIDPGRSWASPVRGAAKDTTFVSFFVYASVGTSIDIAGAKIVVRASAQPDRVQLQIGHPGTKGIQWRNFGGPVRLEPYGGVPLAALPVLTVRLDGMAGVWDLYVGGRLGAVDLPLPALPRGATKQFTVHGGSGGARVCGLISSDDNPLFTDENRNGIDDAFELQRSGGAPLAARSTGASRAQLAKAWQEDQQARQPQLEVWTAQRPPPDAPPQGKKK